MNAPTSRGWPSEGTLTVGAGMSPIQMLTQMSCNKHLSRFLHQAQWVRPWVLGQLTC